MAHGGNWRKKQTQQSKSARRMWKSYYYYYYHHHHHHHLSDGRKWKWREAEEQEKMGTKWNIYVLWQYIYFIMRWNSWILHVLEMHNHYIWIENNEVNETISAHYFMSTRYGLHWFSQIFIPSWYLVLMKWNVRRT
jgi:hypothetical protein